MNIAEELLNLPQSGQRATEEYLRQRTVSSGIKAIDEVLEGGLETGNYYLFLGNAKNGKSTILRCMGISYARKGHPVLYCNYEQPGKNTFAKIYQMLYGKEFRAGVHGSVEEQMETEKLVRNMPTVPFYIAFWVGQLESNAFNGEVRGCLKESIDAIAKKHDGLKPLIILENLTDVYNEREGKNDNTTNIVSQTARDIKKFAIDNDVVILLAHHTGKLNGEVPNMDNARDSGRVTDLAHSIFAAHLTVDETVMGIMIPSYQLLFLAGRSSNTPKTWDVDLNGLEITLKPGKLPEKKGRKSTKKFS
jgi:archaellum biogenesis ATPase FlaH